MYFIKFCDFLNFFTINAMIEYPPLETDWSRPRAELYELRDSKFNLVDKGLGRCIDCIYSHQWPDHQHDEPRRIAPTTLDIHLVMQHSATVPSRYRPTLVILSNN